MKNFALAFFLTLVGTHASWGKAVDLSLPEAIAEADIIARIRVDDDVSLVPLKVTRTPDGKVQMSRTLTEFQEYLNLATVTIVQSFKGDLREGSEIKLLHTTCFCPSVIYEKGREYVVFLRKRTDSDRYETMNYYAGQFPIEGDKVTVFYLIRGFSDAKDGLLPYKQVSAFLKEAIEKQKRAVTGPAA